LIEIDPIEQPDTIERRLSALAWHFAQRHTGIMIASSASIQFVVGAQNRHQHQAATRETAMKQKSPHGRWILPWRRRLAGHARMPELSPGEQRGGRGAFSLLTVVELKAPR
jgi:hypothetical protein